MDLIITNFKRIIRSGAHYFWRNGFVSLASISVMVITLSVLTGVLLADAVLTSTLNTIRDKVDVNVYFTPDAEEEEVLRLKGRLEELPEVESVEFTSRQQALENFRVRYRDDQVKLNALEELDENPLRSSLNITATDPSQYESIAGFLEGDSSALSAREASIVDHINYQQNKVVIDRLSNILQTAEKLGFGAMVLLIVLSIIITFNTIRLAIYISRDEISVMRLVGASQSYIRGPFVVNGMLYGAVSATVTLAIFLPLTYWFAGFTTEFFVGFNVFNYYVDNFGYIFLWVMAAGIVIGAVSSYLAVKRYLKI